MNDCDCCSAPEMEELTATPLKLYIAVLDEFPDYMVPTLVAHSVLNAHMLFEGVLGYESWINHSFKKVVVRVSPKEFAKIAALENVHIGSENNTLGGKASCIVVCPREDNPNVLKYAKLWAPKKATAETDDS